MIEVKNLDKVFSLSRKQQAELGINSKSIKVLDQINFSCQPGRIFSLLGPNGAGKTTALRIISTILAPSAGSVSICGMDVVTKSSEARRRIGFLTGSTGLYERLTPDEIVTYFGKLNGVAKKELAERKERLFELLDISEFAKKRIGKLSTGMKQKVSIARTIVHNPDVIVFDEPTSGLDVITAENIIKLINDCKEQGKTVIFSSHVMSEVDLLCDDLAIIHKGKIIYSNTMENFRLEMKSENLTKEFIRLVNESTI